MNKDSKIFYVDNNTHVDDFCSLLQGYSFEPHAFGHQHHDSNSVCDWRIIGDFELIYVVDGISEITIESDHYTCQCGDLILIPPFKQHTIQTSAIKPHNNYWIHFDVFPFYKHTEFLRLFCSAQSYRVPITNPELLMPFYELLEREFEAHPSGNYFYLSKILSLIFMELLHHRVHPLQVTDVSSSHSPRQLMLVRNCIDYIQNHLHLPLSPKVLCKEFHISESYLYKSFSNIAGISPNQFIQMIKIKKAEQLLKTTPLSIKQIAETLGFSSQYYFSSVFKQHYKLSPSNYAQKYRLY